MREQILDLMSKQKILLVHLGRSSFVANDIEILSCSFEVVDFEFRLSKNFWTMFFEQLRLANWLLLNIWTAQKVFVWFCDYHAFLPVLFFSLKPGKGRSFVVLGGFDSTYIESIDYGVLNKKNFFRFLMSKLSLKWCDFILPVDQSLICSANRFPDPGKPQKTGVLNFMDLSPKKFRVVPTSYDSDFWVDDKTVLREDSVVVVASVSSAKRFLVKGVDFALDVAQEMPEVKFYVIGVEVSGVPECKNLVGSNVELLGRRNKEELVKFFQKSKVVFVPSLSEGLPNALCEGMLCGCVPVVTDVASLAKIVDNCGFVVEKRDSKLGASMVKEAIRRFEENSSLARKKIAENYHLSTRRERLLEVMGVSE